MTKANGLIVSLCLALAVTGVQAAEPLVLQKIMKDLGENMRIIGDGISREDWGLVAESALLIADHPQPPLTEKMRIMRFVGINMARFKAYNGQVLIQAQGVGRAANVNDGIAVALAFQKLRTVCDSCHYEFRDSFLGHFYQTH